MNKVDSIVAKFDRLYLRPGDDAILRTPGGGGWGDPAKRSPESREADRRRGYYRMENAAG